MADKIPQGLSCGLCLEADEPGSFFAVPIKRRFAEAAEEIPICVDCATAIMKASGVEVPVEPEEKPDVPD